LLLGFGLFGVALWTVAKPMVLARWGVSPTSEGLNAAYASIDDGTPYADVVALIGVPPDNAYGAERPGIARWTAQDNRRQTVSLFVAFDGQGRVGSKWLTCE
jgi:hypothetical protein